MPCQLRWKPGAEEMTGAGVTTGGAKPATRSGEFAARGGDRLRGTVAIALASAATARAFGAEAGASRLSVTLAVRDQFCMAALDAPAAAGAELATAELAAVSTPPPMTRPLAASGTTTLVIKSCEVFT